MDYQSALKYIEGVSWLGSRPGLERISELLERLGRPQDSLRFVHVAGTNGKGSVCSLLRHVLTAAGYRTGLYISPHLMRMNERMSIDGADISDAAFAGAVTDLAAAAQGIGYQQAFKTMKNKGSDYRYKKSLETARPFSDAQLAGFLVVLDRLDRRLKGGSTVDKSTLLQMALGELLLVGRGEMQYADS